MATEQHRGTIMLNSGNKYLTTNKRGIVLFVVMGVIFVLAILILSYNHLVRGKFRENRATLEHIRAMKYAQATSRYIVSRLQNDLLNADPNDTSSPGNILRNEVFKENDVGRLNNNLNNMWLDRITGSSNAQSISSLIEEMAGDASTDDVDVSVNIQVSDLVLLNSIADPGEMFLPFEKAGRITVSVDVYIGRTYEVWQETRPFRVVMPYPVPMTKFTLYLRDALNGGSPVKFNTVQIDSATTGRPVGYPRPLVFFHNTQVDTPTEDVWKRRGWVYMGGGDIYLNRAAGAEGFGQRFHSYPVGTRMPVALILNYLGFNGIDAGSDTLMFRKARWGFSNNLISGPESQMWREMLASDLDRNPGDLNSRWWRSSILHLFGNGQRDDFLSPTRVSGNVYDRFINVGYLVPASGNWPALASVISRTQQEFEQIVNDAASDWIQQLVLTSPLYESALGVSDLSDLEPVFASIPYERAAAGPNYNEIMTKTQLGWYHDTYNMIIQYSQDRDEIGIPPRDAAPSTQEPSFLDVGIMGQSLASINIPDVGSMAGANLGMDKRVTYEISASDADEAFILLRNNFATSYNDFRLGNSVVRIDTGGAGMQMLNDLGIDSGGTIIVDSSVTLGEFKPAAEIDIPLAIIAETGNITVRNRAGTRTLAYLVAMDPAGGQIRVEPPRSRLDLIGGIAAHTLEPEEIEGGGIVRFNDNLDPTRGGFDRHIGVVIGPAGGEI